jgi:hypothetical protein
MFLFIRSLLGDDLIGRRWGGSHEEVRRIAAPEHLGKLLEVNLIVLPDVDEGEDVLQLLVLRQSLACLRIELLHHAVELLKGEIAAPGVVPLPKSVLRRYHVVVQQIADMLQLRL